MQLHRTVGIVGMVAGLALGVGVGWWLGHRDFSKSAPAIDSAVTVTGAVSAGDGVFSLVLSDGRLVKSRSSEATVEGIFYEVDGKRYRAAK